jgi:hypothetical protein
MKYKDLSSVKTRLQIASEYGVCVKTLNRMLKEAEIELKRGLITPSKQEEIYLKLGRPRIRG